MSILFGFKNAKWKRVVLKVNQGANQVTSSFDNGIDHKV
jgi:hypothetical protein